MMSEMLIHPPSPPLLAFACLPHSLDDGKFILSFHHLFPYLSVLRWAVTLHLNDVNG